MDHLQRTKRLARTVAIGFVAASLVTLAGCGEDTSGDEEGTSVGDIQAEEPIDDTVEFEGAYDDRFAEEAQSYAGETVVLSADVNDVISDTAFTIAGTDNTSVEEFLVLTEEPIEDLEAGSPIEVTGTVHKAFDLPEAEDEIEAQLDEDLFEGWAKEPYLEAETVDTTVEDAA